MGEGNTTASIQHHLDKLGDDFAESDFVRVLLEKSASRLAMLCGNLLHRRYPRLTSPPLNLSADELLGSVIERLIKALRHAKPVSVRQFFALANQHIRWELNELARRLDTEKLPASIDGDLLPGLEPSDSQLSDSCKQILELIEALPHDQREVFELVRIQCLPITEVAQVLEVTEVTVRRRLSRALSVLSQLFEISCPDEPANKSLGT